MVSDITYLTNKMEIAILLPCSKVVIHSFILFQSKTHIKSGTENVTQSDKTLMKNIVPMENNLLLSKHCTLSFQLESKSCWALTTWLVNRSSDTCIKKKNHYGRRKQKRKLFGLLYLILQGKEKGGGKKEYLHWYY